MVSLFLISLLLANCTEKTPQNKIKDLIVEHAKQNIPDFDSFEIVELSEPDSVFSNITENKKIMEYAVEFENALMRIDELDIEIKNSYSKLKNMEDYERKAERQDKAISARLIFGRTSNSEQILLLSRLNEIGAEIGEIQSLIKGFKSRISQLKTMKNEIETKNNKIIREVDNMCKVFTPQYLGLSANLKCRYKDRNGNMQLQDHHVLLSDSLTHIINITPFVTDSTNINELKAFIDVCKMENNIN